MADEATNQGDRMDERSGRSNSGAGIGGSSNSLNAGNRSIGGNRNDGGVDSRNDGGADSRSTGGVGRKTPRGFAAMDPQAQRAIAAKGGRAAHQKGTAHEFTSEEARVAGRKGGEASRGGRRSSGSSASNT
jgi:general stress protein YciG